MRTTLLLLLVLTLLKGLLAARLDLFADEAFYWQCGQRLDFAFYDHPFMTALLARGGVELLGDTTLGVRFLFLVLGVAFPILVQRLAAPLVGEGRAWQAATLSLVMPGTAHLGVLALPDVPLLFFATLSLLLFERASRLGGLGRWLAAGAALALGFCCHYRFALVPFGLGIWLIGTRAGRRCLAAPGPWLAAAVAALGLAPVLLFNAARDFAPLRYQGLERHESGFDLEPLLEFAGLQIGVTVTPFLFVALCMAVVYLWRQARAGDHRASLLLCTGLVQPLVFLLASPIADSDAASLHWPAAGYVPLLVAAPLAVANFVAARPSRARRTFAALVPGFSGTLILLIAFEAATHAFGVQSLERPFAGWSAITAAVEERLPPPGDPPALLVADNYMLGTNLAFRTHERAEVYVLDHKKGRSHGRAPQFAEWERGEAALRKRAGDTALVVVQWSESRSRDRDAWREHVASFFEPLQSLGTVRAAGGKRGKEKVFEVFRGVVRGAD